MPWIKTPPLGMACRTPPLVWGCGRDGRLAPGEGGEALSRTGTADRRDGCPLRTALGAPVSRSLISPGRWERPHHQQQTRGPRSAILQDGVGLEVGPAPGQGAAQPTPDAVHGPEAQARPAARPAGKRPLPLVCLQTQTLVVSSPPALPRPRATSHLLADLCSHLLRGHRPGTPWCP